MKVKELIAALLEFDMEKEVFVCTEDGNEIPTIEEKLVGCHFNDDESPSWVYADPKKYKNVRSVVLLR